jgi:hypothetical protein
MFFIWWYWLSIKELPLLTQACIARNAYAFASDAGYGRQMIRPRDAAGTDHLPTSLR